MARILFFRVLMNNLKCLFCGEKNCSMRYYPEHKKTQIYDGVRYDVKCKKAKRK